MYMSNEEIRNLIQQHQNAILEILQGGIFELNEKAAEHQQAIKELRRQCDHLNAEGKTQISKGICTYCGTKL